MPASFVRPCVQEDIPWLLELAKKRYADRIEDIEYVRNWLPSIMGKPDILFIRSDHSMLAVGLLRPFYSPSRCRVATIMIGSHSDAPWETLRLFRHAVEWAKSRGCRGKDAFAIDSITGYDISPLALRLGAQPARVVFTLEIR